MVTWTADRAAQQHARPARTAEPTVTPGGGGTVAPQLRADGCLNLAFMTSASPRLAGDGRDITHLIRCQRSRTKVGPLWSTRVTSCSDEQQARHLVPGRAEG